MIYAGGLEIIVLYWVLLTMAARKRQKYKSLAKIIEDGTRASTRQTENQQQIQCDLPTELLELIFSQLTLRDNIRASAVCRRWLAVATSVRIFNKPPLLMIRPKYGDLYEFYDPSLRKSCWIELPKLRETVIQYSKDGWLLIYRPGTKDLFFLCPCTQETIKLPRLDLAYKVVAFSSTPTSRSCIVCAIMHVNHAYVAISTCHPGATKWTTVNYLNRQPYVRSFDNKLLFCNGLLYYFSCIGKMGVYNHDNGTWVVYSISIPQPASYFYGWKGKFMVEHNGDIFMICTYAVNPVVYKLDQTLKVWTEMETLGGLTLFVSCSASHSRTDLNGMMRNNIYFSKVLLYGKRCVSYSLDAHRYYPRKHFDDLGDLDDIWIDAPEDLSTFL